MTRQKGTLKMAFQQGRPLKTCLTTGSVRYAAQGRKNLKGYSNIPEV